MKSNKCRLYIDSHLTENQTITLSPYHQHYIMTVLRLKSKDQILVFNSVDGEFSSQLVYKSKHHTYLNIIERIRTTHPEKNQIHLAQCIIKPNRMTRILDMVTQLGISTIIPIISEYSQYKTINLAKYHKVIIEACEQSNRIMIPKLSKPIFLDNFIKTYKDHLIIWGNEDLTNNITLENIKDYDYRLSNLILLIGPEGGFSSKEKELLNAHSNIIGISLGNNILRSETAAVTLLAQIIYLRSNIKHNLAQNYIIDIENKN